MREISPFNVGFRFAHYRVAQSFIFPTTLAPGGSALVLFLLETARKRHGTVYVSRLARWPSGGSIANRGQVIFGGLDGLVDIGAYSCPYSKQTGAMKTEGSFKLPVNRKREDSRYGPENC